MTVASLVTVLSRVTVASLVAVGFKALRLGRPPPACRHGSSRDVFSRHDRHVFSFSRHDRHVFSVTAFPVLWKPKGATRVAPFEIASALRPDPQTQTSVQGGRRPFASGTPKTCWRAQQRTIGWLPNQHVFRLKITCQPESRSGPITRFPAHAVNERFHCFHTLHYCRMATGFVLRG